MKSKGLDFPDNFMDIFGFHRANEVEQVNRQKELELMADFDEDKYIQPFCKRKKCNLCNSLSEYGEDGDGCEALDKHIKEMYQMVLAKRIKTTANKEKKK
jgi:hypothetical protein